MSALCKRLVGVCWRRRSVFPLRETQRCESAAAALVQPEFLRGSPHRKHPGMTNLKTLRLPEDLQRGALILLHKSDIRDLAERSHKLSNYLWSRKRAVETAELREKAIMLEKKWIEKEIEHQNDVDDPIFEDKIRKKVLTELKKTTYRWMPLRYDAELGVLYTAARLAGGYAAVLRALNEIKKRDPSFTPRSLLDFGSGLGTAVWASHTHWGDSLTEYVCVDSSAAMNTLAEQLLTAEGSKPLIKHVYFRQFLPVSPKVQSDLVTAAFSLSELATKKDREETVLTLWRKTHSYLVLVENGTKEGHQILMEARDVLLKKEEKAVHDSRRPLVFAPCAHELWCPKLLKQPVVPCNFLQPYYPLPFAGKREREQEKFSYLIMSREDRGKQGQDESVQWARLTAPVQRRTRHVQCQICCPSGELKQLAITAHHHGRDMYRCARSSDWGDRLPLIHTEDNTETDETQ